jgi:DNA helicase II / ATP-dependent DNA helicase PcrA
MRFAGDFHIHSHYSRATSRQLTPENLDLWGRRKGLAVLGTGDFTHPGWTEELRNRLIPAEEGLFVLKDEYRLGGEADTSSAEDREGVRFILTAEVSSIYKYGDKVRKVHNLLFAPDFDAVFAIQREIERLGGNIRSDGRPILGMDSRDLLELCLEADERNFFVPAHIWTPWFSALGSKSGFETLKECYRDLSAHITAVETGLSSDPPMN